MELKDIDISKSYSTKSTQKYIIKDSNDCFFEPFGIVIPNHNKMNIYSHGEKLIHRDLNVRTPTNFSIVSKR